MTVNKEKLLNGLNLGKIFFNNYNSISFQILFIFNVLSSIFLFLVLAISFPKLTMLFSVMNKVLIFLLATWILSNAFVLILNFVINILLKKEEKKILEHVKSKR